MKMAPNFNFESQSFDSFLDNEELQNNELAPMLITNYYLLLFRNTN